MATWPSTLPSPQFGGYQLNPVDPVVRTNMEVGALRARRRSAARLDHVNVAWLFTDAQMAIFRAWFDDGSTGVAGGAGWFTVTLATGDGGKISVSARFAKTFRATLIEGMSWRVAGELEIR